jgi:hypothetical protein
MISPHELYHVFWLGTVEMHVYVFNAKGRKTCSCHENKFFRYYENITLGLKPTIIKGSRETVEDLVNPYCA